MGLVQTGVPAEEPVSLTEAKLHCRVAADLTDDDGLIGALITAAREHVESATHRALVTQTWRWTLDRFPCQRLGDAALADAPLRVPRPPLQTVTSISYLDADGTTQTLDPSTYTVDADSQPGRIVPVYGQTWPTTQAVPNAVTVVFVAGYGAGAKVPQALAAAIKLLVGHWYEHREGVVTGTIATELPLTVRRLTGPYWMPEVR